MTSCSTSRPERFRTAVRAAIGSAVLVSASLAIGGTAHAHEGPDEGQAAYVLADWMLLVFLVFFLTALVVFLVALKRGLLRDPEAAKYHLLEIDEPDYYTPAWAKEDGDAPLAAR